ncbi:hypothetical protein [Kineococcus sp. SYSU DK002]|uniref:hypothetical protein n=1 Tax=Kineococcus sp. SYSU DK002 TaxID=3383123 RepID=UPI003D7D8E1B
MTSKQRTYALIGAAIGFVVGLLVHNGDRSTASMPSLAVGQAIVAAVVGYFLARDGRRARRRVGE